MSLLSVKNLSVSLRNKDSNQTDKMLVDSISFEVEASQVFALVGESGSGKSLTANALMRLLSHNMSLNADTLKLDKLDVLSLSERQMNQVRGAHVAMIFQEPQSALNPVKTLGQQLKEVLKLHRAKEKAQFKQIMLQLLEEVGLEDGEAKLGMYPHQLSGGQKQRLMIAMALAGEPKLLIADEPTTALDVTTQKQILDLLLKLKHKRGLSILFITHDMSVVAYIADVVAVMQSGKLIETQTVHEFFKQPKEAYSKALLSSGDVPSIVPEKNDETPLLKVKALSIGYQKAKRLFLPSVSTQVVNNVSFSINKGETFALVGESGSGKTTIGRALINLIEHQSGQIIYKGECLDELSRSQWQEYRKQIQIIFQDPFSSMNPRLTVGEIIQEGMKALMPKMRKKERLERVVNLMLKVGLKQEHLKRFPHEFSGGQRQRIAIARALVLEPELLICDEPTSALDASTRHQILALLQQLQQEMGLAYLFITHDLNLVSQFAHRVAVMQHGQLVEQGASRQVLDNPTNEYTQKLVASSLPLTPNASA